LQFPKQKTISDLYVDMAKNKTVETKKNVGDFLKTIKVDKKREDCSALIQLIAKHTGLKPKMWGTAIVGFGSYHYQYESGREGDAPLAGLSPRANALTIYLSNAKEQTDLLKKLGKHKIGGGCLYFQKLEDIDTGILTKLVDNSIKHLKSKYPGK
jgi:hypothetical protein